MAEEKHHHHLFHHHKDGEQQQPVDAVGYSETTYGSDGTGGYTESTTVAAVAVDEPQHDYEKEMKQHKNREHLGELGALAAGAFALVNTTTAF